MTRRCSAVLGHLELWVLGLLAAVAGLVTLSNFFRVPYPVFLVLGGLALGFVPGVPELRRRFAARLDG